MFCCSEENNGVGHTGSIQATSPRYQKVVTVGNGMENIVIEFLITMELM